MENKNFGFEGRLEFFGSVFWDFEKSKFYLFDEKSTDILKRLEKSNHLKNRDNNPNLEKFYEKLIRIGLIKNSKINYYFLKNSSKNKEVLSAPMRIHYAITSKCNLNCKHCFTRNILSRSEKELTPKERLLILNQIDSLGIREMLISGGEPFLADNFIDFLKEAEKRRINVKIFSNGLMINQELLEKMKNIKIDYLAISMDGADGESICQIRGSNLDFKKLKENIKLANQILKCPIILQITVSRCNFNQIKEYISLALETGIKRIKLRAIKPGGSILTNKDLMISPQEYLNFCLNFFKEAEKQKLNETKGVEYDATLGNIRLSYNSKKKIIEMENLPQPYRGFGCVGGRITLFIDSFGYVHPCAFIDNFLDKNLAENIKEKKLIDIWNYNQNILKMRHLEGNSKCKSCKLYSLCRGGCRARAVFLQPRNLNAPDGWCPRKLGLEIKK